MSVVSQTQKETKDTKYVPHFMTDTSSSKIRYTPEKKKEIPCDTKNFKTKEIPSLKSKDVPHFMTNTKSFAKKIEHETPKSTCVKSKEIPTTKSNIPHFMTATESSSKRVEPEQKTVVHVLKSKPIDSKDIPNFMKATKSYEARTTLEKAKVQQIKSKEIPVNTIHRPRFMLPTESFKRRVETKPTVDPLERVKNIKPIAKDEHNLPHFIKPTASFLSKTDKTRVDISDTAEEFIIEPLTAEEQEALEESKLKTKIYKKVSKTMSTKV
ncbi:hypothetical protein WA158_002298 [Blastocystis sp. Blastoise]